MIENSFIEINKKALKNNISFIRKFIGNDCELASVVKGNAYGHGIKNFVPLAYGLGVKTFAVFSAYEAKEVLESNTPKPRIIIMGFIDDSQISWAIEHGIEFYVFDFARYNIALKEAHLLKKKAKIHIEVETGLNRTGFARKDLATIFKQHKQHGVPIEIVGICSHLAGAESVSNYLRIKNQIRQFNSFARSFDKQNFHTQKHLACSAAMMNYPQTIKDMVRVGIMQYGFWPSKEVKMAYFIKHKVTEDPLQPVLSWKSKIMSLKTVKMSQYIGYGSSMMAEKDMNIASVPVGYADGFARSLSNQGKVLVNGVRLDVIGIVNMNLMLIDVTNCDTINRGDEVVIIGEQEDNSISVASFSDFSNQLNYELLTRLPNNIPRLITN